jgi:hypothetical protein
VRLQVYPCKQEQNHSDLRIVRIDEKMVDHIFRTGHSVVGITTHESLANFTDVSLLHVSFHCAPHPDQMDRNWRLRER